MDKDKQIELKLKENYKFLWLGAIVVGMGLVIDSFFLTCESQIAQTLYNIAGILLGALMWVLAIIEINYKLKLRKKTSIIDITKQCFLTAIKYFLPIFFGTMIIPLVITVILSALNLI